jgi:hypothetical protein
MPVNPEKPRVALIVHGVQTGADKDQNQHLVIKQLIKNRLGNIQLNYKTDIYRYEDINDKTISPAKKLVKLIAKTPVGGKLIEKTMDLIGDVVLNLADNSTAAKVRAGLNLDSAVDRSQ